MKIIAFDLDGTIADTLPMCLAAFRKAVQPYVARTLTEEEIMQTFGLNEEGMIRQVAGVRWREALDDFYACYRCIHALLCPAPFSGMRELIRKWKGQTGGYQGGACDRKRCKKLRHHTGTIRNAARFRHRGNRGAGQKQKV